ncbi:MAG TPA: iron ABC transporter permease [Candidatus Cloacimonadota bacterium]|nr:iron ABC transporter permease [Candidatus Cloacimonadota bacterium]
MAVFYLYLTWGISSEWVLVKVRLPRFLLTLMTGMILAGVGSTYQMMLNNPLAEPYILGISAGGAFFATLAAVIGLSVLMPLFGFGGAILTMIIVWTLAHARGYFDKVKLLLSGIIAGMFFSACLSLLMYLNQQDISVIINILMGNLGHIFSNTEWLVFLGLFAVSIILMLYLLLSANKLNIVTSGDLAATTLGVDVKSLRRNIFFVSSILTGITVAYAGIIGFVGLIVPHMVRLRFGSDQKKVFPLSIWGGALFLLICDFLAMHLTVLELPVGIITAFIGCPLFVYLMIKR